MIKSRISRFALLVIIAILSSGCRSTTPQASPSTEDLQPRSIQEDNGADSGDAQPSESPPQENEPIYSGHGETMALIQYFEEGRHRIVFLDPFGLGFREIRLPEGARLPNFSMDGLSPDGAHYAYYTGSTDAADLTLVVFDLNSETISAEIPLLSSDYPENFQEIVDGFIASGNIPEVLARFEPEEMAIELEYAFVFGIETLSWSPSGRYLAFSGQMEGPSSDLYILDAETMEITRLTTGTGMMERIGWSPDEEWIRHTSIYFVGAGYKVTNHVAARDGSQVISFPTDVGLGWGPWLTNNLYLAHEADNGPGKYRLMVMDARTGSVRTLFDGAFYSYAVDSASNTILLQSYWFFDDDPQEGLYLIQASEPYTITPVSTPGLLYLGYIGLETYPYIGSLDNESTVLITSDGSLQDLADLPVRWEPAPSANILALSYSNPFREIEPEVWIYDVDNDQRTDVYAGMVEGLAWRPDSGALFYLTDPELHIYSLDTGEYMLVYAWPGIPVASTNLAWVTLP